MTERIESQQKTEKELIRSNQPLAALVDTQTMVNAGFNYDEVSILLPVEEKGLLRTRISEQDRDGTNLNIVIIEEPMHQNGVKWREWYFGTFSGKSLSERTGKEEEGYYDELHKIYSPEHRVNGEELEELLSSYISTNE